LLWIIFGGFIACFMILGVEAYFFVKWTRRAPKVATDSCSNERPHREMNAVVELPPQERKADGSAAPPIHR